MNSLLIVVDGGHEKGTLNTQEYIHNSHPVDVDLYINDMIMVVMHGRIELGVSMIEVLKHILLPKLSVPCFSFQQLVRSPLIM